VLVGTLGVEAIIVPSKPHARDHKCDYVLQMSPDRFFPAPYCLFLGVLQRFSTIAMNKFTIYQRAINLFPTNNIEPSLKHFSSFKHCLVSLFLCWRGGISLSVRKQLNFFGDVTGCTHLRLPLRTSFSRDNLTHHTSFKLASTMSDASPSKKAKTETKEPEKLRVCPFVL